MTRLKMRPDDSGPEEQSKGSTGPSICLPLELYQETLDSLHYALRMQESLEYRLPSKHQQAELQENIVMLLEKLEEFRKKAETQEACSSEVSQLEEALAILAVSQVWQESVSKSGREEPSNTEELSRTPQEDRSHIIVELNEAMRLQAEELEQLKLQLSMTTKLFEQLGVNNLLNLLRSEDTDICRTATKALANLAAQESFQEEIVQVGGLKGLFDLFERSVDEITHRLAAGAVANLAVNESNQIKIVEEGGLPTLCELGRSSADPQTQKMVAGAIANLCGNGEAAHD
ncbi:hypothetical protein KFL_001500230 [Klebsormidium nitens]|uniref:Vacuolar protein 8 n=1 Tax=Klebsormidium nitens TaxID=105231 RepID=A0A1Y1HZ81_KLENI|nr:hypothetical protein KFL_001500230 [Klebsormidium nitens]|eukprot:GAQ83493.1 hypothetical protein KFL_001500230 [Klebsormidium nitens]